MLSLQQVHVVYDRAILVLKGVSIEVAPGSVTALLGANGAGKSTTLKAISGLLPTERGSLTRGTIWFGNNRIDPMAPHEIVAQGIVQVFEGRRVFEHLSVEENLIAGGHTAPDRATVRRRIERVFAHFPRLKDLRKRQAGYLSGGEQQMLAIGRALMAEPKLMMLDEPSLGLAPIITADIFSTVSRLSREEKIAILLVEQNASLALSIADYGYVLENGHIVLEGSAQALMRNDDVKRFYLGLNASGARRSYRELRRSSAASAA